MSSLAKERRLGRVLVSGPFVREHTELLTEVFYRIKAFPLQLEHHFDADTFEYTLFSPQFEICNQGEYAPKYELLITNHYDKKGVMISYDIEVRKLGWNYHQPYNPTNMEMMLEKHLPEGKD
mgnify:CR=1 FL=1